MALRSTPSSCGDSVGGLPMWSMRAQFGSTSRAKRETSTGVFMSGEYLQSAIVHHFGPDRRTRCQVHGADHVTSRPALHCAGFGGYGQSVQCECGSDDLVAFNQRGPREI